MATYQGTHSEQEALSGQHRGRATAFGLGAVSRTPEELQLRSSACVVADTHELATRAAKFADQLVMRSIGYTAAQAAVLRGRP
jgi:hypothetical protein